MSDQTDTPAPRCLFAVILAADPELSLVECLGVIEAESPEAAIDAVLTAYPTNSPQELATHRNWSPLADGEDGGPQITAEVVAYPGMPFPEALESVQTALWGVAGFQMMEEFPMQMMARGLLASFGILSS